MCVYIFFTLYFVHVVRCILPGILDGRFRITLSEPKALRAELNLPENALLYLMRQMGVGPKLNSTVEVA